MAFSSRINAYCYIPRLLDNKTSTVIDSLMRGPDQIQMYPDQDTIPQLLPALDVLLRLLQEKSKYITKHLMSGPSGN